MNELFNSVAYNAVMHSVLEQEIRVEFAFKVCWFYENVKPCKSRIY